MGARAMRWTATLALVSLLSLARACAGNLQSGALRTIDEDDHGTMMTRERYALDGALALEPLRATGVESSSSYVPARLRSRSLVVLPSRASSSAMATPVRAS